MVNRKELVNENQYAMIVLYIITCSIAFITKLNGNNVPMYVPYGITSIWIFLAFIKWGINGFSVSKINNTLKYMIAIFLLPRIVIHLYSVLLYFCGQTNFLTRNTQAYLIVMVVFSAIYLLGTNVLKYTIVASILSYSIVFFYNIIIYGIGSIPETIIAVITGNDTYVSTMFEMHDFIFGIGFLVIYFIFLNGRLDKKNIKYCLLFCLFMFLGLKRIQILAIACLAVVVIIGKHFNDKKKYKYYLIVSFSFIIVAYVFIAILSDAEFFKLLTKYGINAMGRNYYYKAIISLCKFDFTFWGYGRNYVTELFQTTYSYMHVDGVHSDILKYYTECGFILFGAWMWYYLIKVPKLIYNKFGFSTFNCYYVLTLFSFLIYYTDNTDTYFVTQFIYMMIIIVTAMKDTITKEGVNEGGITIFNKKINIS